MPKPSTVDTVSRRAHAGSWAEVRAHDQVIRYRRCGVGRAVLLLRSADDEGPIWLELFEALGAGFRLIAPESPASDVDVGRWLANFLEGLGISNVAIVAAHRFRVPALELALQEDQIANVILMLDHHEDTDLAKVLETATQRAGARPVRLLVVRQWQPAADIVSLVTRFLEDNGGAAPA